MSPEILWAVFGWCASAVIVFSLCQTKLLRLRIFNLIGSLLAMTYNLPLSVWPAVGLHTTLALINVIHLVRIYRARRRTEATTRVVEVSAADPLLAHILGVSANESLALASSSGAPARVAFAGDRVTGCATLIDGSWILVHGGDHRGMLLAEAVAGTSRGPNPSAPMSRA